MAADATRRDLIRSGIAGAGASALIGPLAAASAAAAPPESDAEVLGRTLRIERLLVVAYRHVLATDVLLAAVRTQLGGLLRQELQHVSALVRRLERLGASIPQGFPSTSAAQTALGRLGVHRSLSHLPTQHDCLRLLINVESVGEEAYFKAIAKLHDPGLLRISTEIMGCEAQHWTVLSGIQHHGDVTLSVPYPFVGGASS